MVGPPHSRNQNAHEYYASNGDEPLLGCENSLITRWDNETDIWALMKKNQKSENHFFDHVTIAQDGGLSEINQNTPLLWYDSRFASTTFLLLFVVYNIFFLLEQDVGAMVAEPLANGAKHHFLITSTIFRHLGIELKSPEKAVSAVELLFLFVILFCAVKRSVTILFKSDFCKWQATAHLCWFSLPDLSCYSAIKILQFVTPQQLMYDLNYVLWYEPKETQKLKLLMIIFRTPLAWIIGLDTFLVKLRLANHMIMDTQCRFKDILGVVILLNQILGVVQIAKTIRNRLYRFVFAGEDGMMTSEERVRQDVWEAMVAERIFAEFPFHKAVALMLSWCDDDFQMLALNDSHRLDTPSSSEFHSGHEDDEECYTPRIPAGRGKPGAATNQ